MQSGIKLGAIKFFGSTFVFFVFFSVIAGISLSALAGDSLKDESAAPYRVFGGLCTTFVVDGLAEPKCGAGAYVTIEPYKKDGGFEKSHFVLNLAAPEKMISLAGERRLDGNTERFDLYLAFPNETDVIKVKGTCEFTLSNNSARLHCDVKDGKGQPWRFDFSQLQIYSNQEPTFK